MLKFTTWVDNNNIICNRPNYLTNQSSFTNSFNIEFVKNITKLTNIEYNPDRRVGKTYGIFIGIKYL